jgi:hypothetical protein
MAGSACIADWMHLALPAVGGEEQLTDRRGLAGAIRGGCAVLTWRKELIYWFVRADS